MRERSDETWRRKEPRPPPRTDCSHCCSKTTLSQGEKLNMTSLHTVFLDSWVRRELSEEEKNQKQGRRENLEGWLDNRWEKEETRLREKNKPPNSFLKLLWSVRYEPQPFSTVLIILGSKWWTKTPNRWPRILTPAAKENWTKECM